MRGQDMFSPREGASARTERARRIECAKNGHSRLRDYCFGYHYCVRCGDTLGDSLGGIYSSAEGVYVHHMYVATFHPDKFAEYRKSGCNCPENAKKLTKKDLKLIPRYNSFGYSNLPPWKPKKGAEVGP